MRLKLQRFLFLIFWGHSALYPVLATHIVGGEITYTCKGNNVYEIALTVFRDCDTGVPWFDSPAAIGIFNSNNQLVSTLWMPLSAINDTLEPELQDPCLVVPPNVCIHRTTYTQEVTLPFIPGGYLLAYQRCCRNQDIVNIVAPLETGATYTALISEQALLGCNNSAVFNEWPPVYICRQVPIVFDHSATDADGDSLVYDLVTPLNGATTQNPMPQPPFNPPYAPVQWVAGFGVNNMLGNAVAPLQIDPQTGLLTGTPSMLGTYVVGVRVREFRNGVLISSTQRDFQYVIGVCGLVSTAAFAEPQFDCNSSLTVYFQNQSQSVSQTYFWNFDTTNTNATSSFAFPSYTYPDTGFYTVMLVTDPGLLCADTLYRTIHVQLRGVDVQAQAVEIVCKGDTVVLRANCPQDNGINAIDYQWSPATHVIGGTTADSLVVFANQNLTYTVVVENQFGCRDSTTASINITNLTPPLNITAQPDSIYVGQTAQLQATSNPNYLYTWVQDSTLNAWNVANPIAAPTVTTTYYLTVTQGTNCFNTDSVTVYLRPPLCGDPLIFVPSAFTPNGDGLNDMLYVRGNNITELFFVVYDRWGERVFETSDLGLGWDGTFRGKPLPPDVYGFYLRCVCEEGQSYFHKGNVSLLR